MGNFVLKLRIAPVAQFAAIAALAAVAVLWVADAKAQDLRGLSQQDTLTGDWGGFRSELEEKGVSIGLNYTFDLNGNPFGGVDQGVTYAGLGTLETEFDFGKLLGVEGLTLFAAGAWAHGQDLSANKIGNLFTVQEIFSGRSVRLAQLYLQQSMADDAVSIALGRLATGDDFATADIFGNYVNVAVNGNPAATFINIPSFTAAPSAQWGVRGRANLPHGLYLAGGAYNADPAVQDDDNNGVDFRFNPGEGVLFAAEAGIETSFGDAANPLPGTFSAGLLVDTSDYAFLDESGGETSSNLGFYAIAVQKAFNEAEDPEQGLTPWLALTVNPNDDINTLPVTVNAGAVYHGLIPGRDEDATAVGLFYGSFSDDLAGQSFEMVLEANHRFQIAPWLYVTPDLQYVINPGGFDTVANALVLGMEASIDF